MKSTFLLQIFAFCWAASVASDQKISGSAMQADGTAASFATVLLYHAADTRLAKGASADDDGKL